MYAAGNGGKRGGLGPSARTTGCEQLTKPSVYFAGTAKTTYRATSKAQPAATVLATVTVTSRGTATLTAADRNTDPTNLQVQVVLEQQPLLQSEQQL